MCAEGYQVHLLSGDSPAKVAAAAERLGVEAERARGALDPEAKATLVEALDDGDTLMVGDGINDSLSFEAALCTATPAIEIVSPVGGSAPSPSTTTVSSSHAGPRARHTAGRIVPSRPTDPMA